MNNTITVKQNQYLLDVSPTGKIRPWRVHKLQNQLLSIAYETVDGSKSTRLLDCATEISFSLQPDGSRRLASANFCRVRLCPMCSWRRGLKVFGHTKQIMDAIEKDKPMAYVFVTLTVKNCTGDMLSITIDSMMKAWNRLMVLKPMKCIKGYYRGLEITHNIDPDSPDYDTFHPHLHCVFAVNPSYFISRDYIPQALWTSLWRQSMRLDYDPIVDVRRVKGSTAAAVSEAAKYAVKPGDYIVPDDWDLTVDTVRLLDKVLNKRRLVAYGGLFKEWHHKLNLDDEADGDLVNTDATEPDNLSCSPKIWYSWQTGYNQYCLRIKA